MTPRPALSLPRTFHLPSPPPLCACSDKGERVTNQQLSSLKRYAKSIREILRGGPTNVEQALAPSFKNLIDDLLPTLPTGSGLITIPEYSKPTIGRPDIALVRAGELPRAFI